MAAPLALVAKDLVARATAPQLGRWQEQIAATGYCAHPIRLSGRTMHVDRTTGEVREVYDTADEPDAVLLTACGNRRESRCPSCAATYRADAYQLVRASLEGDKGVPESIAGHPRLFVTFTAPSFGPVHTLPGSGAASGAPVGPATGTSAVPTAARSAAGSGTSPTIPRWAPRSASTASTPRAWSCGTRWRPSSGAAPPSTCVGHWRPRPG
jgi:hypothetical protein